MKQIDNCKILYAGKSCLFVVNVTGQLKILFAPFRVITNEICKILPPKTWVYVDEVIEDEKYQILYLIENKFYPHYNFQIHINY